MKNEIPKSRKSSKYPLDDLKVNESYEVGKYSVEKCRSIGGVLGYYNKTREKHFVQRKVNNKILIYRSI